MKSSARATKDLPSMRRPRARRAAVVMALALAGVLWTSASLAQVDEGPIVIGKQRKVDPFHLDPPKVTLDLTAAYRHDSTATETDTVEFNEVLFTQAVGVETQGYIFTPSFIELNLMGNAGIQESFLDLDGDSSTHTGEIYDWDLRGTYRKDSDNPFNVFSQRQQQWISREFGPTLESIATSTGAQLGIRRGNANSRLMFSHGVSEQTGLDGEDDFSSTRNLFAWNTGIRPDQNNTITWNYTFSDVDQAGTFETQYQSHTASLTHDLLFGNKKQNSFTSGVNYDLRTGDQEQETFRWDERLRLRHTRDFETRYEYRLDYTDFSGQERLRNSGRAGFIHQLYQSLTTSGNVHASHDNELDSDFATTELGGDLTFNYRKKVPLGTFFSNFGLQLNRQENSARTNDTTVLNQPGAFIDPLPIVITGTNVDPTEIVITDPSGLTVYTPGLDYTVTKFSDRVEINRVVGGAIPNLAPVLIDYGLLPLPGSNTTTRSFSISGRYELNETFLQGLAVYATYIRQNQSIDTEDPSVFNENDFKDVLFGTDYTIGPFRFGAERQVHDSDLNPLSANRFYARYVQRFEETTFSANGAYTTIDFPDTGNHTELFTLTGQLRYQITRRLSMTGTIAWRDQQDDASGDTVGFEQQLEMQWTHRQTTIYMDLRNSALETEADENNFQFFQVGVRREF